MEYRYYTVEKREDGYRVYGWRDLPGIEALKAQDFGRDVVATFPDESQALRAFPYAKTIMRGKSLLLRAAWPEEHGGRDKVWTITYLCECRYAGRDPRRGRHTSGIVARSASSRAVRVDL